MTQNRIRHAPLSLALALLTLGAACPRGAEPVDAGSAPPPPAPAAQTGPRIACDAPEFDAGVVLQGTPVKHTFVVRNTGDAPLLIKHVNSACGASVEKPATKEIPPGGELGFGYTVETADRQGALTKTMTVYSNDPQQMRLKLSLSCTVEVLAGFEPAQLRARNVLHGTRLTQQVKLIGREVGQVKLQGIRSSAPEALSAKAIEVEGKPALEVAFQAGAKPGRFEGEIVVQTGLTGQPEAKLPVLIDVTGDLVFEPEEVDFGLVKPNKASLKAVRVWSLGGKPFEVKGAADPAGLVAVEVQKKGAEVVLEMSAMRTGEEPRGEIVVKTGRKDQPELRVPYRMRVLKRLMPGPGLALPPAPKPAAPSR